MKEIRARALTKRSAAKEVLAHTERESDIEKVGARKGIARRGASLVFEEGGLFEFFFLFSLVFPKQTFPFTENANFLENEKKKVVVTMSKMLLRRRAFSTTPRTDVAPTNVRAFFEKNPDAAEAVPLLVFVSTGEWFYVFLFLYLSKYL